MIISRQEAASSGLKRFFTAEPCFRSHVVERLVSNGLCIECARINKSADRARNQQRENARRRRHEKENPELVTKWRANCKPRLKQPYVRPDPAKSLEWNRRWKLKRSPEQRRKDSLKRTARDKLYPEGRRARDRNRSARKREAEGRHTAADVLALYDRQKGKCATCKCVVTLDNKHVDHIKPLARGGSNWPQNLQILCSPCNLRKSAKDPVDWARENGMLV